MFYIINVLIRNSFSMREFFKFPIIKERIKILKQGRNFIFLEKNGKGKEKVVQPLHCIAHNQMKTFFVSQDLWEVVDEGFSLHFSLHNNLNNETIKLLGLLGFFFLLFLIFCTFQKIWKAIQNKLSMFEAFKRRRGLYVASGFRNHMTRTKENFVSMDEKDKSKVKLGDGK